MAREYNVSVSYLEIKCSQMLILFVDIDSVITVQKIVPFSHIYHMR